MTNNTNHIRATYGVDETFGLEDGLAYHSEVKYYAPVTLAEVKERGGYISRVRILAEVHRGVGLRGDISYIHATIDGNVHPLMFNDAPFDTIGFMVKELKGHFIAWGKATGVYAKGIGLLDEGNWSILK